MFYPKLKETYTTRQVTDVFYGYNHNLKIGDGEFYDMKNLTSSHYPLLAERGKRGIVAQLGEPVALLGKSKLAYIDGSSLYYGGNDISTYLSAAGFAISTADSMKPKQLVSMGAYIVIYPDKLYINTENYTDCGSVEAHFTTAQNSSVEYSICKADGSAYDETAVGTVAPSEPENGKLWIDTNAVPHTLKQYNTATASWVDVPTVYTKISYAGIGGQFKQYDGVNISGCSVEGGAAEQVAALNGSHILYACYNDYIVVTGLLDMSCTQTAGSVRVDRAMPDVDYLTEAGNRLWGCKYGLVNGKTVNEIYCCALGDFKNWNQFLGLATDSYVASVGTDGPWTGAVTHLGYPLFFKENCMHKVYISGNGAHQIIDTACRGVQKGSHNSLAVVNETLYFKSVEGVCAYDGSLPVSVSSQLGTERYFDAAAGAMGDKYYVSMRDADGQWHVFAYDTRKGLWHREDDTQGLCFARCGGELYCLKADGTLMCMGGSEGTPEKSVEWSATTGIIGYTTVEQKYVSRFLLRMRLEEGATMDTYIRYDSQGAWHHAGHVEGGGLGTFLLPVRPRRCDHFQLRMDGCGSVRIYSTARIFEKGSDVV